MPWTIFTIATSANDGFGRRLYHHPHYSCIQIASLYETRSEIAAPLWVLDQGDFVLCLTHVRSTPIVNVRVLEEVSFSADDDRDHPLRTIRGEVPISVAVLGEGVFDGFHVSLLKFVFCERTLFRFFKLIRQSAHFATVLFLHLSFFYR